MTKFTLYFDGKPVGQAVGTATVTDLDLQLGDGTVLLGPSPKPHTYQVTVPMSGAQGRRFLRALRPTRHTKKAWARLLKVMRRLLVRLAGDVSLSRETKQARASKIVARFKNVRVPRSLQ